MLTFVFLLGNVICSRINISLKNGTDQKEIREFNQKNWFKKLLKYNILQIIFRHICRKFRAYLEKREFELDEKMILDFDIRRNQIFVRKVQVLIDKVNNKSYTDNNTPDEELSEKLYSINLLSLNMVDKNDSEEDVCKCFKTYRRLVNRLNILEEALLQETITVSKEQSVGKRQLSCVRGFNHLQKKKYKEKRRIMEKDIYILVLMCVLKLS